MKEKESEAFLLVKLSFLDAIDVRGYFEYPSQRSTLAL